MEIRFEEQLNSSWGEFVLPHNEKEYKFPCHIPSREIFNLDPDSVIRGKCLALILLTPVVSVARSVYWLAQSIFMALAGVYRYLDGQGASQEDQDAIYETAQDSVRALGYGVLLTGCAFIGVGAPYWGRLHYGWLERSLNRHVDGPHRDKYYLAYCFQRLSMLPEDYPENCDQVTEKLTKYLDLIHSIRAAIFSGSFDQLERELRLLRAAN